MNFTLSEEHEALRDSAQVFLDKEVNLAPLLKPGASVADANYEGLWAKIVEMGWPGIVVPAEFGGLGMTYLDLAMILSETGRTLAPSPFFGTLAGAWAVERGGSDKQKAALLGGVAGGELKLALAVADTDGETGNAGSDARAVEQGGEYQISGSKSFVVDGASADKLIVAAALNGQRRFFIVDRAAKGVSVDVLKWRDITRQVCTVTFNAAAAELMPGADAEVWPWVRDRLYMTLAAESAAVAKQALADTVEYAKERVAFGRPIGAYQSIKHALAEIAGQAECAVAAVHFAAWALGENDPRAPLACAMAQSYCSEAAKEATHRNIQVFGAIGFTWEMKNHLYYKRARANSELLGSPRAQREEVVQMLEREHKAA
ncbi:MAG: acyl-CoA dehydrogenase family protein [Hyphomonadaceae bacterium]